MIEKDNLFDNFLFNCFVNKARKAFFEKSWTEAASDKIYLKSGLLQLSCVIHGIRYSKTKKKISTT